MYPFAALAAAVAVPGTNEVLLLVGSLFVDPIGADAAAAAACCGRGWKYFAPDGIMRAVPLP